MTIMLLPNAVFLTYILSPVNCILKLMFHNLIFWLCHVRPILKSCPHYRLQIDVPRWSTVYYHLTKQELHKNKFWIDIVKKIKSNQVTESGCIKSTVEQHSVALFSVRWCCEIFLRYYCTKHLDVYVVLSCYCKHYIADIKHGVCYEPFGIIW